MAKGLKAGDSVAVSKPLKFKKTSNEYKAGLKSLELGQIGQVVDSARGRSVIVEFEGKRATISSQRLEKMQTGETPRRRGRRAAIANPANPVSPAQQESYRAPALAATNIGQPSSELFNYDSPKFAASIANKLLLSGGLKDENASVVVEIRLSDLPAEVRERIQALMQAKLSLGLESEIPTNNTALARQTAAPVKGRRGRRPKAAQA